MQVCTFYRKYIDFNHQMTQSTSTMLIYSPGHIINAVSTSGFEVYVLSVERTHLHKIAASLGLTEIEEKLNKIDRVELDEDQANRLREQLQNILTAVSRTEDKVNTVQERDSTKLIYAGEASLNIASLNEERKQGQYELDTLRAKT